jgi:carbon storage regulator
MEATTMSQLVVTRKPGERIMIDGGRIVVTVVQVDGGRVRVGIEAPVDVVIDREELHLKRIKGNEKK